MKSFMWVYFVISLYPLIWMVFYSFKNNDEIFLTNTFGPPAVLRYENYITAWNKFNIPVYLKNSMIVTFSTVIVSIVLSVMFSYAVARLEWRFQNVVKNYMTLGMFIPIQVIMIPLTILVKDLHLANTHLAVILPYIAFNLSFPSLIFYAFFRTIPTELEEAACMDGASIYRTFFSIMLPMVKPAVATVAIFVFLKAWNEMTMALVLIPKESLKTLPLGLLFFQGQFSTDWGGMGAAMTIASIPTVFIYLIFSEQVEKALTVGSAVKG